MKRAAFVTYKRSPEITSDDLLAVEVLRKKCVEVVAAPWDDPTIDWGSFDLVILRSCWDYHRRPEEFRRWILDRKALGIPLMNPADTVLWNMHKSYLKDLSLRGVPILPTVWLPKGSEADLEDILLEQQWPEAVVKPMISADAENTLRSSSLELTQEKFRELQRSHDLMVQRFSPELVRDGELSLTFFNRRFSHLVRKIPVAGDFRTQKQYGPTFVLENPTMELLQQADKVLSMVSGPLLYARVDGLILGGQFTLLELELIEPWLIMCEFSSSANAFSEAILKYLN